MVVRGRLAFDDQGRLVEIAEDAEDPNNPQSGEIDPVEFEELIAQTAGIQDLDAAQLVSALDANGFDISNVGTLSAEEVVWADNPPGALVQLDGDQTISDDSLTVLEWADTIRDPDNLLDSGTNAVVIPDGFSWAKVTVGVFWRGFVAQTANRPVSNGSPIDGGANVWVDETRGFPVTTAWFSVESGDEISAEVRQETGESQDVGDLPETFMEVELK